MRFETELPQSLEPAQQPKLLKELGEQKAGKPTFTEEEWALLIAESIWLREQNTNQQT